MKDIFKNLPMWIQKTQVALVCDGAAESENLKVNLKLRGYSRDGVNQERGFIQMYVGSNTTRIICMKCFETNLPMWILKTQVAVVCGGEQES